jgi:hypothetical protein
MTLLFLKKDNINAVYVEVIALASTMGALISNDLVIMIGGSFYYETSTNTRAKSRKFHCNR